MKDKYGFPLTKIGIIGGGQLAKMMAQSAKRMGFFVLVLDPAPDCPASSVCDRVLVGDFYDDNKIREIAEASEVITYDIEHIATRILKILMDEGYKIFPSPALLEIIQDKFLQKQVLYAAGIPVPKFKLLESLEPGSFKSFGFPCVQKARKGGYDGRGVQVIRGYEDLKNILKVESYLEEYVDIEKELAVIVARSSKGEVKCYPVVEMIFDEQANICDMVIAPARISEDVKEEAKAVAVKTVEILNGIGVFGIELFLTKDKKILVNEVAPRPHNSGHYTIEACITSQFEQHIRAITGLPLGSTKLLMPAVMANLLGEKGYEGPPLIEGLKEALSIEGLSFHFYGKSMTKPFRKMGHITILDENIEKAIEKAVKAKKLLKITSEVRK
ncbi:5-(carboxyamino)imidazole ribonucleotide synthase [Thermovenabulum gondwanense]|uniref:N5-carboxyaminoimidazole ribonucleotide synthase n=1 Tax=Thermovenabulum gondwanense TaxID=520767 RepID=A0A162MJE0_9FIRM|nr:5-(carboxyamino)imidazole ribonucleotide synthase [Thermovenabulum gondwanense]KYO66359.1 N5-carboxyaminoimidazole ribonucleotide synthase [Thermovenabulum gondwanense]